jgi:hypothetical protein
LIPKNAISSQPSAFLEDLMNIPALFFRSLFAKVTLAAVALGGFLVFAGAPAVQAESSRDCNRRVAYTDMRYHQAVEHFGPYSHAARHWARERREALARCREWR